MTHNWGRISQIQAKPHMNIAQLSITYLPEQDRILVKILTQDQQELRLWLTRKLTAGAWPLLQRVVLEHTAAFVASTPKVAAVGEPARQAMAEFKRAETLEKADFSTPYAGNPKWMPLGGEPLLVSELKISPKPEGRMHLHFAEKPANTSAGRGFDVTLEQTLIHGLMKLLESAISVADWALIATASGPMRSPSDADKQDADVGAEVRPKYLN